MFIENGETYFENRKEQVEYNLTKNFILSFYKTKKDYSNLLNNINYIKTSDEDKAFQCFKKDMNGLLYLLTLECPKMKTTINKHMKNQDTVIRFVLKDVFHQMVGTMKEIGLVKTA